MVQLIKKGGLRERANRSRTYQGSENRQTTLRPNSYNDHKKHGSNQDEVMHDVNSTTTPITTKTVDSSNSDPL